MLVIKKSAKRMDRSTEQTLKKKCPESAAIYLHLAILIVRSGRCLQNHFWWALHGACSTFRNNKTSVTDP
jgi:hypothetical protein